MSDLAAAAAAVGAPEELVQRSAEARAQANGTSVEEVLAAWAGGGSAAAAPAQEAEPTESPAEEPAEEVVETPEAEPPAAEPTTAPTPAPLEPAAATAPPAAPAPAPTKIGPEEVGNYPVVVTVPTAGIKERTNYAVPAWLMALFLVVPAFGLIGLVGGAETVCDEATQLQMDRQTGNLVNCDGSAFEGRATGGGAADFIGIGEGIYPQCAGCHGANGEGGVGPPLGDVMNTFGACQGHIDWVGSGTAGFQAQGIATYGDTGKPVGGGGIMRGFEGTITPEEIASVVAYERVRFGAASAEEVLADCGLVEAEESEEGAAGAEEGGEDTATTVGEGATETTAAP